MSELTVVIGGAGGGIGSAAARHLASRGATVVLAGHGDRPAKECLEAIRATSPRSILVEADLSRFDAWSKVFERAYREFHRIDVVVNCVGKLIPGAFSSLTPSEIERMVGSNILSVVYGTRAVLPYMKSRGKGIIINVGSLGGIVPTPFESLYSAAKFAVRGFTLSMHEELRDAGVAMCLLSPGSVRTKMLDLESTDDESVISFSQRPLEPADAVAAIARLIERPRREIIIPRLSGFLARMVNFFPALFGASYPALRFFGARNLRRYREKYASPSLRTTIGASHGTSGRTIR